MFSVSDVAGGRWGRVVWATDSAGQLPAREFFLSLSVSDKAKVVALFSRFAEVGRIESREKFKKVADDLWEFKSHQLRFIGDFRPGRVFVVAHGVRKKRDDLRPEDLEKAKRILAAHDARQRRVG